jgi:hypothetical protein
MEIAIVIDVEMHFPDPLDLFAIFKLQTTSFLLTLVSYSTLINLFINFSVYQKKIISSGHVY